MGEAGRGAQFEHAGLLLTGDLDGSEEAGFRPLRVRLRPIECDLALQAMQVGEPEPLPGSFDKGEGFLQRRLSAPDIVRREQGFGEVR